VKTASERDNGTLGRGVVQKIGTANVASTMLVQSCSSDVLNDLRVDRCVVDDGRALLHLGNQVLGQEPEGVNVGVETA